MSGFLEWLFGIDAGEYAGEGSWHLRFIADYSSLVKFVLLLALVGLVYLTVRSYRREGDTSRRVKAVIATIRILVILLIFAVLFRPAAVFRIVRTLHSAVVVLVDDSLSMSFTDRYDARGRQEIANALSVDPENVQELTRMDLVRKALDRPDGAMAKLARRHPLILMRFSTTQPGKDVYTLKLADVALVAPDPAAPEGRALTPEQLKAALKLLKGAGYETNIPAALRDAIESVQGLLAKDVVILSDGQMTTEGVGTGLTSALAYADARGIRRYGVLVGDPTPPKNVAVTGLQAPREVRRDAKVHLTAVLAHRNVGGQTVTLRLFRRPAEKDRDAETLVTSQTVTLADDPDPAGGGRSRGLQSVSLLVEPGELGEFVYRAAAEPLLGERNEDDNSAEAPMKVSDKKIHILLISGDAGWEVQRLRNFLLQTEHLYRVSSWQQNADKELNQLASTGMKLARLPRAMPELVGSPGGKPYPGYDVVIVYDPQHTAGGFDGPFVKMLQTFVKKHNGGLCYIVGNKYTDGMLRSRGDFLPLAEMIPVVLAANTDSITQRIARHGPDPWDVRLTSYGVDHPVMRLGADAKETLAIWRALPKIYWAHPIYRSKPGARVLAVNPYRRTKADNKPEPLVAVQRYGTGRVALLGFDATWRWLYLRDGYYHNRFWANMIRYLATLKARQVVITTGGDRFTAGERITIEVEAYDADFNPWKAETFEVDMIHTATGEVSPIRLTPVLGSDGKPTAGQYRATITPRQTGAFELTALRGDPEVKDKVASKRILVELPQAEAARSEADEATMETLASRPENFLRIQDIDTLPERIPAGMKTAVEEKARELWDSNLSLLLVVVLLAVEWILRKRYNMA